VYNNPKHSDVILQCGDHQIFAHKAVLCMWSPFFDRGFNSQLPIAESSVFIIDPDDNGEYVSFIAVLKHIYGMTLQWYDTDDTSGGVPNEDHFTFLIKAYIMADKYDFPSVRMAIIALIRKHFNGSEKDMAAYRSLRAGLPDLPGQIAHVCGPSAPMLADTALRNFLFTWIVRNFTSSSQDADILAKLKDGSMLDLELTLELPLRLGERIRQLIKLGNTHTTRTTHYSFGDARAV
jgi:hypothetical protein